MPINAVLVKMLIPSLDPQVDGVSVELKYVVDGGAPNLLANCVGLFNTVGDGADNALCTYMGPVLDRGTGHCTLNVYDITSHLDGTAYGSPVYTTPWTLGTGEGTPMPEGVTAVVGYRADYGSDVEFLGGTGDGHKGGTRPRARDRNHFKLGPLCESCITHPTDGSRVKWTAQFVKDALNNAKQVEVIAGSGLSGPNQWNQTVWSRKGATTKPVFEYYMDDHPGYLPDRVDHPGTRTYLAA